MLQGFASSLHRFGFYSAQEFPLYCLFLPRSPGQVDWLPPGEVGKPVPPFYMGERGK